jgi:hypothetical protein
VCVFHEVRSLDCLACRCHSATNESFIARTVVKTKHSLGGQSEGAACRQPECRTLADDDIFCCLLLSVFSGIN